MTKKEFIDQYNIKDALPLDPSKKAMPAEGFAMALEEFLTDKFRGAVIIERESISAQAMLISAEYLAYFFKILLTDIYARQILRVNISSDMKKLNILISTDEPLCLTERELRDLIRLARNAGMEISPEECSLRLSVLLSPAMIRRVYAISVVDSRLIMLSKLGEIFFCGEPLRDTDEVSMLMIARKEQMKKEKIK